jgi:hypothetical protein
MSAWTSLARRTGLQRTPFTRRRYRDPVGRDTRNLVYRRAGGRCEIGLLCGARMLPRDGWQFSHRVRRSEGLHGPQNGLVACRFCHAAITSASGDQYRQALDNGWLVYTWPGQPQDVPVLLPDGRTVLLTVDGTYLEVAG